MTVLSSVIGDFAWLEFAEQSVAAVMPRYRRPLVSGVRHVLESTSGNPPASVSSPSVRKGDVTKPP